MLASSPALVSFLGSGQPFVGCDLYVITLQNGTKLYVTSLDRNVTYTGTISSNPDYGTHTYISLGQTASGAPAIQRSRVSKGVGKSSKIDLDIFCMPGVLLMNQQLLVTIALGYWSNAQVFVRRAFILPSDVPSNWNTPIPCMLGGAGDGTVVWFLGYVGQVTKLGMLSATLEVRDLLWYLNRPLPKNLFSPGCYHQLFDAGCTVVQTDFTKTGNFLSGCTTTTLYINQTQDQNVPGIPVYSTNPLTYASTEYTIPATTYYAQATYVTALGETAPSAEWSIGVPGNNLITLASPPSVTGASYWNAYVGTESGDEQLQLATIPIGTNWTENGGGIGLTGVGPPQFATNGYWSLGQLSVTYNSGIYSGQTYSAFIETSTWNGSSTTIVIRVPLPQAPLTSDSYSIIPGCDKRSTTCGANPSIGYNSSLTGGGKFGNLLNIGSYQWTPVPETAV